MRLNLELDKVNWQSLLQEESVDEMSKTFISTLTEKVSTVIRKKSQFNQSEETEEKSLFSSKNKIPRNVRILMRNKRKLSKLILNTKSLKKYLKFRDRIEVIEKELQESYVKRRQNQEK